MPSAAATTFDEMDFPDKRSGPSRALPRGGADAVRRGVLKPGKVLF